LPYSVNAHLFEYDAFAERLLIGFSRSNWRDEVLEYRGLVASFDLETKSFTPHYFNDKHNEAFQLCPTGGWLVFDSSAPEASHWAVRGDFSPGAERPPLYRGGAKLLLETDTGRITTLAPSREWSYGGGDGPCWLPDGSGYLYWGALEVPEPFLLDPFAEVPYTIPREEHGWVLWIAESGEKRMIMPWPVEEQWFTVREPLFDGPWFYLHAERFILRHDWSRDLTQTALALPADSPESIYYYEIVGDTILYDVCAPGYAAHYPREALLPLAGSVEAP